MNGIIVINKPQGYTSHDCVAIVRRQSHVKRVGHTGTLDPMATGVLPVCIGKATRIVEYLEGNDKTYQCTMKFGLETDTGDIWGRVLKENPGWKVTEKQVRETLKKFQGEIEQVPPKYAAIKVKGKKLYEYARAGEHVEIQPRKITIYTIDLHHMEKEECCFTVKCSKGTYIRSLCQDIGRDMGTLGTMSQLTRVVSGEFSLADSVDIEEIKDMDVQALEEKLFPLNYPLKHMDVLSLTREEALGFIHGRGIVRKTLKEEGLCCIYFEDLFLGIGQAILEKKIICAKKVFITEI